MITDTELFGLGQDHLVEYRGQRIHPSIREPLQQLIDAAAQAGFEVDLVSAFRGYDRQKAIWDAKFSGQRPMLDAHSRPMDSQSMSELEKVRAILQWSAMPGASRHHWGTDVDLCARNLVPADGKLELITQEYQDGGHQYPFATWLEDYLPQSGFFRPYTSDRNLDGGGAVGCEPWHLSYAPVASEYLDALTLPRLESVLRQRPVSGQKAVLDALPELYQRYVLNIDLPEEARL